MHTSSILVYHTIHPYIFFAMTKKRIYFLDGGENTVEREEREREEREHVKHANILIFTYIYYIMD